MDRYEWIDVAAFGEAPRGSLNVLDRDVLPFDVKRVFWISQVAKEAVRGEHGHVVGHEIMVPLQGAMDLEMWFGSGNHETVRLDTPTKALWLKPGTYIEMKHFEPSTLFLVLCSHAFKDDPVFYSKPG